MGRHPQLSHHLLAGIEDVINRANGGMGDAKY